MKNIKTALFVKSFRLQLKLSQKEFAKLFDSTRNKIARYELGDVIPPGDLILKIHKHRLK